MSLSREKVIVVAVCGATCSGKSTIASELHKILPDSKIFCQDDYFLPVKDPRHLLIPELNHINFDILGSLDMEQMTKDIEEHVKKESKKILRNIIKNQRHVVIVEGFCILNHKPLADLCDLKFYITLNYEECLRRRLKRVYEPPDCPGYFETCAWPEHLKHLQEVKENVKEVQYFDGNTSPSKLSKRIMEDIVKFL
ncbi:unnamed protein product [Ceutorhynchus assimilis]|uniref:Nicotinamide riboside kinase 2 n=1 Tax=Ceutorhynchus assimilis TaxID=467358 RepID=A0A9N9QQR1_9CUCU|nr:unnamed protein product [Ceutorhynchus assimilis]